MRDALRALVEAAQAESARAATGGAPCDPPAADDVLSLLLALLARARLPGLVPLCVYCDTFLCMTESSSHKGELGYALANLPAATEHVRGRQAQPLCAQPGHNGAPGPRAGGRAGAPGGAG